MKKLILLASLAGLVFGSGVNAQAQTKIGIVDMNRIFSGYYKTKDAETKINDARGQAKKEFDDKMELYKKNLDTINKLNDEINNPAVSADGKEKKTKERDEKIGETKTMEREITEFKNTREKQLQEQAIRMRNAIVEEITKLVLDRVKSDGYELVLDKSGSSLNGVPLVLYAKEKMDFTEDIIAALNKGKSAAPAPETPKSGKTEKK